MVIFFKAQDRGELAFAFLQHSLMPPKNARKSYIDHFRLTSAATKGSSVGQVCHFFFVYLTIRKSQHSGGGDNFESLTYTCNFCSSGRSVNFTNRSHGGLQLARQRVLQVVDVLRLVHPDLAEKRLIAFVLHILRTQYEIRNTIPTNIRYVGSHRASVTRLG